MNTINSEKLKRLALQLYAAGEYDRQWVLDKLSIEEAKQLNGLLDEIKNKKLPADPQLIEASLVELKKESISVIEKNEGKLSEYIKCLENTDQAKIMNILHKEDAWIIAIVLEMNSWDWQEQLEKNLNYQKLMKVQQLRDSNVRYVKNQVNLALLKSLIESIDNTDSDKITKNNYIPAPINQLSYKSNKTTNIPSVPWWSILWR